MLPKKMGGPPEYKVLREAYGVAYRLTDDGNLKELYRTEGWYSFQVFISDDGRYLVQMGPWNIGSAVNKEDLAVAFHKDGKLQKRYSTADLIKDHSKVEVSASHYRWRAPSLFEAKLTEAQLDALEPRLDYHNKFTLHTIDGWTYQFDATTGEIISTVKIID